MTKTEAIKVLINLKLFVEMNDEEVKAIDMAIEALGKDIDAPKQMVSEGGC